MPARRRLSLDKDVLSQLESDELAQLAAGAVATLETCITICCPQWTGYTCFNVCNVTGNCTYNACPTVPVADCFDPA